MWSGHSKRFSEASHLDRRCQKLHTHTRRVKRPLGKAKATKEIVEGEKQNWSIKQRSIRAEKPAGDAPVQGWSHRYWAYNFTLGQNTSLTIYETSKQMAQDTSVKWLQFIARHTSDINFYVTHTKMDSSSSWQVMWKKQVGGWGSVSLGISLLSGAPRVWLNVCTTRRTTWKCSPFRDLLVQKLVVKRPPFLKGRQVLSGAIFLTLGVEPRASVRPAVGGLKI